MSRIRHVPLLSGNHGAGFFPTSKVMSIAVGDGMLDNDKAVLLDITVNETNAVSATVDAAMEAFNASRNLIHKCFFEISKPIHEIMRPVTNDASA